MRVRGRLRHRNMPEVANLTGAVIFVVRAIMGMRYRLCAKREHRQNQRQDEQAFGQYYSHSGFGAMILFHAYLYGKSKITVRVRPMNSVRNTNDEWRA